MRSLDEILGPIMIGPSSSHTAGASRISKIARIIADDEVLEVSFYLHGSFGKTYKGHGTDRALVGGILMMDTYDENIIKSLDIAKEKNIKVNFIEKDLGSRYHPNTVKIVMKTKSGCERSVIGSSIGGGNIEIVEIDNKPLYLTGKYNTLLIRHIDKLGIVHKVSGVLSHNNINIAYLRVFRDIKGMEASMIFELDGDVPKDILKQIRDIKDVCDCIFIKAIN